ncbi:MAG: hypothetical protein ACQEP5_01175 [Actinomycetota bacterium]
MYEKEPKKRRLSIWEKMSIVIIVFLIITILVLVFYENLVEYVEILKAWYQGEQL